MNFTQSLFDMSVFLQYMFSRYDDAFKMSWAIASIAFASSSGSDSISCAYEIVPFLIFAFIEIRFSWLKRSEKVFPVNPLSKLVNFLRLWSLGCVQREVNGLDEILVAETADESLYLIEVQAHVVDVCLGNEKFRLAIVDRESIAIKIYPRPKPSRCTSSKRRWANQLAGHSLPISDCQLTTGSIDRTVYSLVALNGNWKRRRNRQLVNRYENDDDTMKSEWNSNNQKLSSPTKWRHEWRVVHNVRAFTFNLYLIESGGLMTSTL